jgi:ketosteroid isomerase-like protein
VAIGSTQFRAGATESAHLALSQRRRVPYAAPSPGHPELHLSSPETAAGPVTTATLAAFSDAWNRHDIDALMGFMSDDCVFQAAGGPLACGARHVGRDAVRSAFVAVWQAVPDAQWINGTHSVQGDFGLSQWTFIGTALDGSRIETDGVDLFAFKDGRIQLKNAFRKMRPNLPSAR